MYQSNRKFGIEALLRYDGKFDKDWRGYIMNNMEVGMGNLRQASSSSLLRTRTVRHR